MKNLLFLALMSLSSMTFSQQIVVFGKEELCDLNTNNSICMTSDKNKQDFINLFKISNFQDTAQINKVEFITPPLQWGRNISNAVKYGEVIFYKSQVNGFIFNLKLMNLLPDHNYIFTLNGNPKLEGNNLLPDTVPNLKAEKYYDFLFVRTNAVGEYTGKIGVYLLKGDYHVRFYVKDHDDFKIVLYHDYFKFKIK